jgi:hypothetical protein
LRKIKRDDTGQKNEKTQSEHLKIMGEHAQ